MFSVAQLSDSVKFSPAFQPRPQISHVVFDFDGTLSWLRHGWPEIMVGLFQRHVRALPGESPVQLHELLLSDILSLNGQPSIHQMRRCAERAGERNGLTPNPELLLQEYQKRLDTKIQERTAVVLNRPSRRDAFVVHGARALLDHLQARNLTLILLSGTAEYRVKQEARLLDLERYFGKHIYGGTSNLAQSSKNAVIDRLMKQEGIEGEHLLSFGDGPVEVQVTVEAGGLAVGVASDEAENGSGKIASTKARHLTAAGAAVLIPDYSEAIALMEVIMGPPDEKAA